MITPKKSLGQNFLRDPNTIRKIADSVRAPEGSPVVEIGPGTGALTETLLERHPDLTAVEVDARAVEYLRSRFPALDVRHHDVLELDWAALAQEKGGRIYAVGNLPYYITSQILFGLIDARSHVAEAVVMMQLEVAERLVAKPRTKAYGILSVVLQRYTDVSILFRVPPTVFFPRPDVTSAVVRVRFRPDAPPPSEAEDRFRQVVRAAFNQRRKTLHNALGEWTRGDDGVTLPEEWAKRRAEELTHEAFFDLAQYLAGLR